MSIESEEEQAFQEDYTPEMMDAMSRIADGATRVELSDGTVLSDRGDQDEGFLGDQSNPNNRWYWDIVRQALENDDKEKSS